VSSDKSQDMPIFTAFHGPGHSPKSCLAGNPAGKELSSLRHTLRATALDDISG
jgi:hypothetical protein